MSAFQANCQAKTEINSDANLVKGDDQGNIYLINGSEIQKTDEKGTILFRYSNALYGNIFDADVTNPLRILIYYREANTLIFLSQQLTEIGDPIDIDDVAGFEAYLACGSRKGGFWLYDINTHSICYYGETRTKLKQTQNLSARLNRQEPLKISEQENQLYLILSDKIMVFDCFGSYLHTYNVSALNDVKVIGNWLYYWDGNALVRINILLKNQEPLTLPQYPDATNLVLFKNNVLFQLPHKLVIITNF